MQPDWSPEVLRLWLFAQLESYVAWENPLSPSCSVFLSPETSSPVVKARILICVEGMNVALLEQAIQEQRKYFNERQEQRESSTSWQQLWDQPHAGPRSAICNKYVKSQLGGMFAVANSKVTEQGNTWRLSQCMWLWAVHILPQVSWLKIALGSRFVVCLKGWLRKGNPWITLVLSLCTTWRSQKKSLNLELSSSPLADGGKGH